MLPSVAESEEVDEAAALDSGARSLASCVPLDELQAWYCTARLAGASLPVTERALQLLLSGQIEAS